MNFPATAPSFKTIVQEGVDKILEHAGIGIAQLDTSGRYLLVNDVYCELVGRSREELLAGSVQDITHPEDLPASLDAFIRAIETGVSVEVEQRCIRGDGSIIRVSKTVSTGRNGPAAAQYLIGVTHDISRRVSAARPTNQAEADLRLLLDTAADGFYCVDREGRTTLCNAAFLRMLGFKRDEDVLGRDLHDVIHHSRPDGSAYPRQQCPIYKVIESGTHAHVVDEVFFRVDGSRFPVEYWVRPILRDTTIQGAVCTFIDLTERKQAESRQEILNRELAHRVKNTLVMVQAIVGQTLRTAATPRDAASSIAQRLAALGNAHNVLMRTQWGNAAMMDVVEGAIALHRPDPHRFRLTGPHIDVGSKAALAITLALHELCTNAAKYGALSRDAGTVLIEWSLSGGAADAAFRLSWTESGGPAVTVPKHKGFGSQLIGRVISSDLRGDSKLVFDPSGVRWTLDAPLSALKH